jgi:hypothetical protein
MRLFKSATLTSAALCLASCADDSNESSNRQAFGVQKTVAVVETDDAGGEDESDEGEIHGKSANASAATLPVVPCPGLVAHRNKETDASRVLQACIDTITGTKVGSKLEIPAGAYTIASRILINRPMTLATAGVTTEMEGCLNSDNAPACATLRASAETLDMVLQLRGSNIFIDHIVVDGRKSLRGSRAREACRSNSSTERKIGPLSQTIHLTDSKINGSVFQNTPCGTAMEMAGITGKVTIARSTFKNNGDAELYSDGLTIHNAPNSKFFKNIFMDNADVDVVWGGCAGCTISGNRVVHTVPNTRGSFAGFMIHAFALSSPGDYEGAIIKNNVVDCGPGRTCGAAFLFGSRGWYVANPTKGFKFYNNIATNAQTGFMIGTDVEGVFGDNYASATTGNVKCPANNGAISAIEMRQMYAYEIGDGAKIKFDGEEIGMPYFAKTNTSIIPNWNFPSNPSSLVCGVASNANPLPEPAVPATGAIAKEPKPAEARSFAAGQFLTGTHPDKPSCSFKAIMQNDGNFVIYHHSKAIWQTKTNNNPGAKAQFRANGNFVVLGANNSALFSTNTPHMNGKKLVMQGDGNLVIYNFSGRAIWASGSVVEECSR